MVHWSSGYVSEIGYTYGYYTELNPLRVSLAFLNAGLLSPDVHSVCELGFGQGLSANIHAAASKSSWYGTDFNPAQAGFARELAGISDNGAHFFDKSFADFVIQKDLPDFDYIGIHGIWSWISDDNRKVIVDFIRRKLKVGGVLYISYNTFPGWATFAPIRHLMAEHAEKIGSEGRGLVSSIENAIGFAEQLLAVNPLFAVSNPSIPERFKKIKGQNRNYLAHEYFNRDWHPMHFSFMRKWLEPAKVEYACSAHYMDHIDNINLTKVQQDFLAEIPDAMFREDVRDFMVNQQFRRDYWIKGGRRLNPLEQAEILRRQKVILIRHRSDISLKVKGALGEADMNEDIYSPVLRLLADFKPRTLGQIEQILKSEGLTFGQLFQAIMVLVGAGHMAPAQDESIFVKTKKSTDKLNQHLMFKARGSGDISVLASPLTGGGISVGRFEQLFLLAINQGKQQPEDWAKYAWQLLLTQGQKLMKDGNPIESDEQNLKEFIGMAHEFGDKKLPVFRALKII